MIGIFGGTFDPVHNGHIETVEHVLTALDLEQVRLVPLRQAVHREQPIATAQQRLDLLKAATESHNKLHNKLVVDDCEINRPGGSYTVDTLEAMVQSFPEKKLCLIIGSDAFNGFESWKAPDKILSLSHLAVMQRPDARVIESKNKFIANLLKARQVVSYEELQQYSSGKILFVKVPQINISSTMIREKLARKENINMLVPAEVNQLIQQWQLYQGKTRDA